MEDLVFTRLLYPKEGVINSIRICFIEKLSYEEFIYWCCELYYSGYEEYTFQILFEIYYDFIMLIDEDIKILSFIENNYDKWLKSYQSKKMKTKDNILIKIAEKMYFSKSNVVIHNYMNCIRTNDKKITIYRGKKPEWLNRYNKEVKTFIYSLHKVNLTNIIILSYNLLNNKNKKYTIDDIYELIEKSDIIKIERSVHLKYYTNEHHKLVYDILKSLLKTDEISGLSKKNVKKEKMEGCVLDKMMQNYNNSTCSPRFMIRNNRRFNIIYVNKLTNEANDDLAKKYNYNWLYYAYECPLWKKRISEYGGKVNHSKKEIEFDEEDDETGYSVFDKFHLKYEYEPDEQPKGFTEQIVHK